ncbi:MAG: methyl-accepting chemotaxis protein, partial [Anaerolineae bacterium]|nr:methyl-accepting chemotaxis protein [Anaerolineae bacterium]
MSRMLQMMTNRTTITMSLTAALPVLLMGFSMSMETTTMLLWTLAALLGGWLVGMVSHVLSRPRLERQLNEYADVLERVVLGDLRQRLPLPEQAGSSIEEQVLHRMGDAVNRMLDRLQDVVTEIHGALQRVDADTSEILTATMRQIEMANEQDSVVTETTATVNEVRATVTETAERAQSVAETAQVSVDISRTGMDSVQQTISGMDVIRRRVEDIADNILVLSEHTQQIG